MRKFLGAIGFCVLLCGLPGGIAISQPAGEPLDPFMGDWRGVLKAADGSETPVFAQVICWGKGDYEAKLYSTLEERVEPTATMKGRIADAGVAFGEAARIADDTFTGELTGEPSGSFRLEPFVRMSPTLGAEPPDGAVVLFDGTSLDGWMGRGGEPWVINLSELLGGGDRVAYLRARVWCPAAQPGRLELGSDDGVKAWVNRDLVHSNNTDRPVRSWEDRAEIQLEEGWNSLMLKVVQGGGGWGACARIRAEDGSAIDGLKFEPAPQLDEAAANRPDAGIVMTWELAGPYFEAGKRRPELFDTVFPPEEDADAGGIEWTVVNEKPSPTRMWRLTDDGAMEIVPGSGAITSTRSFTDHRLHIEFRTPFEPNDRGQGRGNSGVYLQSRHEIQILDSYGLDGRDNECGGLYGRGTPLVNMCAPPMQWQTFDVEFRAPRLDPDGNEVPAARMTVSHNGVLIHDDVELPVRLRGGEQVQTGGILLQDHGDRLQFRNIWVVEL